jgi:dihydrolipoamide dehydrogenase
VSVLTEIRVPALGDFKDVPVIEIMVEVGAMVGVEDPLLSLESDKATMDVPAPVAGAIREIVVKVGDRVSEGTLIARIDAGAAAVDTAPSAPASAPAPAAEASVSTGDTVRLPAATALAAASGGSRRYDLVVLGAGPGGYTAAFRAADLGLSVALIEKDPVLGGVCLNVGCIPSKALLHAARVIEEAHSMADCGVRFEPPSIDLGVLRGWKSKVVAKLTNGLAGLAKARKVDVFRGLAAFSSPHTLSVDGPTGTTVVAFEQCIIAAGSEPVRLPGMPDDPRVMDSTGALELREIPPRLLVVGGGIIGLEMATVYAALGTRVTVVELSPGLMPGCDADLVRPLEKRLKASLEAIYVNTKVGAMTADSAGISVVLEGERAPKSDRFDRVLVAVGRRPNGSKLDAAAAGVAVDGRGFIAVDGQMRTNVPHIFAIGDVVGQPMLAHKASHEGKVAAEVAAGLKRANDARVIPSVAYTDPEIAWVGLTELEAKAQGRAIGKGVFPWAASGRSLAINRDEGFTKLLFDPETHRLLGAGIVGTNAGDLIAEAGLAIELGADAADVGLTIHPHPTLSETVAFAAEAFEGTLTDLYIPKKK